MLIDTFDTDKEVLVIAEIGNNHEGSYTLAEQMVGLAAESGAGAVKFQTIVPDKLVSVSQTDRIEQLNRICLSYKDFEKLEKVSRHEGVLFLSTPFDIESVRFLSPLVPAFKVASGDNNFFPLLETVAKTQKPIILSTGLLDFEGIHKTKEYIQNILGYQQIKHKLAILHCTVSYPTQPNEANLMAIQSLKQLDVTVGYSDHTIGIDAALLSVALGARIIEKHFTLDKNYSEFRDHQLSMDPQDLKLLSQKIKNAVELLGSYEKRVQPSEKENEHQVRRSIVASKDMEEGTILTLENLSWVRPGGGLNPGEENIVLGKTMKKNIKKGERILLSNLR